MSFNGNWVDLVILVILGFYFLEGLERGFWNLISELVSFLGALAFALRFYPYAASFLGDNFTLPHSFANALGFLTVAFISQFAISILIYSWILPKIPKKFWKANWQKIGGAAASVANGLVLIAFFLTLFIALPIKSEVKADITGSRIGGYLLVQTVKLEKELANVFGGALRDTLTYFTVEPQSKEKIDLNFKARELMIDESAETQLFELVNKERRDRGIPELVWSPQIVVVARAHSRDMWERHYFSHVNPDGEDPGDRLSAGGVKYGLAGENIALAPTVKMAHDGLMNSEGHKRNILDPTFKKIGIGVIDGGIYGKMFTQNFTD
ncbi:CvpA family protein [Candidatus Microgenomates bacterium]|nr:CvpA family protein [Candidatus Microgenomates bacterium]